MAPLAPAPRRRDEPRWGMLTSAPPCQQPAPDIGPVGCPALSGHAAASALGHLLYALSRAWPLWSLWGAELAAVFDKPTLTGCRKAMLFKKPMCLRPGGRTQKHHLRAVVTETDLFHMGHEPTPNVLPPMCFGYHHILKHTIGLEPIHRVQAQGEEDSAADYTVHLTDQHVRMRIGS